ncbi:MAG: superoxide dismutase [Ni] [Candidatus Tantalella remota]|nr:superoxide dismutase [Ni] [Candidatus Tantalella remota]
MKKVVIFLMMMSFALGTTAHPHCQVPCGIYDDDMRFDMIAEDITTIGKAMDEINKFSQETDKNYNQIVRWVETKEKHADNISHTVTYYFMAQRVKPVDPSDVASYAVYANELELLHGLMVNVMKSKQTTDSIYVDNMKGLLEEFWVVYAQ